MNRILAILPLLVLVIIGKQPALAAVQLPETQGNKPLKELSYAYFPLAVPISVLAETMQRDRLLQRNLARHGFKITFKPFAKGGDVLPLIRNGQIAAVSFADLPTIEALSTADMQAVGFVKQSYSSVVASQGTQVRALRHKRIGNAHGSTSHYALLQALESAGLSERDVILVPMETSQMPEALENGSIDAFAAWEPTPTTALKRHPGRFAKISRQTSYSFFLLSGNLTRSNPDVAREITAALVRAINWLKKSNANLLTASSWSQTGVQIFSGTPSTLKSTDIARLTRTDLLDIAGAPLIPQTIRDRNSLLLREFDFLKKLDRLPANASRQRLEQGLSNRLLHKILAAPAHYNLKRFDYAK